MLRANPLHPLRLAILIFATSCSNPFWSFDRHRVEGTFDGSTCRITLNGKRLAADSGVSDSVHVDFIAIHAMGIPANYGVKAIRCNGLSFWFTQPGDRYPPPGVYGVTARDFAIPDSTTVSLFHSHIRARWPFALYGAYLEGYSGELRIDSLRPYGRDSAGRSKTDKGFAQGRFAVRARRIAKGP